jgi:outer membrane protein assembly factor BamB
MSPVYAIRETATGDISLTADQTSNTHIAWSVPRGGAYMATPIVYGDLVYVLGWNGVLLASDAKTGERVYQERLGGGTSAYTASPVAADGKVYFMSEEGDVFVVKAGRTFEVLATNKLDDIGMATPAISEGVIYFRTGKSLIAIGR